MFGVTKIKVLGLFYLKIQDTHPGHGATIIKPIKFKDKEQAIEAINKLPIISFKINWKTLNKKEINNYFY